MRLIDADLLERELGIEDWDIWFSHLLEEAPIVDAVEVVRCKDCKHWCNEIDEHTYECCTRAIMNRFKPDDFCSYGERKEE